jgi:drug/metabolite transporter (DMT)-like permease
MPIFGTLAFDRGVTPSALLLLRFAMAAALLAALLAARPELRRGRAPRAPGDRGRTSTVRLVLVALGLGAVGYATQSGLYFAALERLDAPLVALVLYTYPALVTLVAALLGRERLTRRRGTALAVASVGTLMVLLGGHGVSFALFGVALAFGAATTYTCYILVSDTVVHRLPPVVLSTLVMTGAAGGLGVRAALTGGVDLSFSWAGWLWVACIAVVSTVVAMLAFFAGLRRVGPSTAAILSTLEPVVTTALAGVVLHQFLEPVQLLGAGVVLCSVLLLQRRPRASLPSQVVGRSSTAAPKVSPLH